MSNARYRGTINLPRRNPDGQYLPKLSEEKIIARCAELHADGTYPSVEAANLRCKDQRFISIRDRWMEENGIERSKRGPRIRRPQESRNSYCGKNSRGPRLAAPKPLLPPPEPPKPKFEPPPPGTTAYWCWEYRRAWRSIHRAGKSSAEQVRSGQEVTNA